MKTGNRKKSIKESTGKGSKEKEHWLQ